jgi:hypothetical protein
VEARTRTGDYSESLRTTILLAVWTVAWLATLAAARFGPELVWGSDQRLISWLAVGANVLVGVGWIVAFSRFLQAVDDLQRKIIHDAHSVTLGVAFVGGFAYVVADLAGLVDADVNVAVFPVVLSVLYMVAIAVGHFRYR